MFSIPGYMRFIFIQIEIFILVLCLSFPIHAETVNGNMDIQVVSLSEVGYIDSMFVSEHGESASLMVLMCQRSTFVYKEKTTSPRDRHVVLISSY